MVLAAAIAVARAGGSGTAGASERETFASCEERDDWMQSSQGAARTLPTTGFGVEDTDGAASASGDDSGGAGAEGSTESTSAAAAPVDGARVGSKNVIVEGIDELDRVAVLSDGRMLATGERTLPLVAVEGARALASLDAPQIGSASCRERGGS